MILFVFESKNKSTTAFSMPLGVVLDIS
ncbi:hypothetical protein EZS27_040344, partial [termite gut metagenome]